MGLTSRHFVQSTTEDEERTGIPRGLGIGAIAVGVRVALEETCDYSRFCPSLTERDFHSMVTHGSHDDVHGLTCTIAVLVQDQKALFWKNGISAYGIGPALLVSDVICGHFQISSPGLC
jgi:hypothetical protein